MRPSLYNNCDYILCDELYNILLVNLYATDFLKPARAGFVTVRVILDLKIRHYHNK